MSPSLTPETDEPAPSGLAAGNGDRSPRPAAEMEAAPDEPAMERGSPEADGHLSRRQELAREVVLEIHALRVALDDALQTFGARVQGNLAGAARRLEEAALGESEAPLPSARALGGLLRDLRAVKLKPRKGRAKDLNRIDRVADELAELAGDG